MNAERRFYLNEDFWRVTGGRMETLKKILGSIPIKGWIIILVVIMGFMMWRLGTIGSGTDMVKKLIFGPYDQAIIDLQNEREALQENLNKILQKVSKNEIKIKQQDAKIDGIKTKISETDKKISDIEGKFHSITIPSNANEIVSEFKNMGYASARIKSR